MRTGYGRHREQPQEKKGDLQEVTEVIIVNDKQLAEKIQDEITEEITVKLPKAKPEFVKEIIKEKKSVERKPVKKKIVIPSPTPASVSEQTYKLSGLALNGNMQEARDFRAICKKKGWVIQEILLKFLKEFNEKNYTF